MVYCVVPSGMGTRVKRSVERALRDETGVRVVEERRALERRGGTERRRRSQPCSRERRRVGYPEGRRVAERRAVEVPVQAPPHVGRAVRQHAGELAFVEPLDVPPDFRRDVEAVRAIVRFKAGECDFTELYERWFDPLYTYLTVTLDRGADVELHVSTVLADALRELSGVSPGPTEVRAWLFGVAYRAARPRGLDLARPLGANGDAAPPGTADETALAWLADDELVLLVERRPPAERHVLVLRYFVGLAFADVASIMGIPPAAVVALHRSAVASLDATLAGVNRGVRMEERHPMGRLVHQTPALRQRRRALLAA